MLTQQLKENILSELKKYKKTWRKVSDVNDVTFYQTFKKDVIYCVLETIAITKLTRWETAPSDEILGEHNENDELEFVIKELKKDMRVGRVVRKMPIIDTIFTGKCESCIKSSSDGKCKKCNNTKTVQNYKQLAIKAELYVEEYYSVENYGYIHLPDPILNPNEGSVIKIEDLTDQGLINYLNKLSLNQKTKIKSLTSYINEQKQTIYKIPLTSYSVSKGFTKKDNVYIFGLHNKIHVK